MQIWNLEGLMLLGWVLLPLQVAVERDLLNWVLTIGQGCSPVSTKLLVRKCVGWKLWISGQNKPQRKLEEMGRECVTSVAVIYFENSEQFWHSAWPHHSGDSVLTDVNNGLWTFVFENEIVCAVVSYWFPTSFGCSAWSQLDSCWWLDRWSCSKLYPR